MGKVSKNARKDRGSITNKEMVKVIKAFKSKKSDAYAFKEAVIEKENLKQFLSEDEN